MINNDNIINLLSLLFILINIGSHTYAASISIIVVLLYMPLDMLLQYDEGNIIIIIIIMMMLFMIIIVSLLGNASPDI